MKNILLFGFFASLIFCASLAKVRANSASINTVEPEIETLIKRYQAPGVSVAIVKGTELIYAKGFGVRDLASKTPVNADTIFSIGSITKSFTSAMVGKLATENKLSLTDSPKKHLDDLAFYNSAMDEQIQLRDLLRHASGIGNLDASLVLFPERNKQKAAYKLRYLKPEGPTKNSWIYSNMGYTLAGAVVEQVAKTSWQSFLQQQLLSPLEMNNSFGNMIFKTTLDNYALGYGKIDDQMQRVPFESFHANEPGGAIYSSATDMSHWMIAWLNEGVYNGKQVIPKNYIPQATQLQNIMPQDGADAEVFLFGDGYGWRVNSHKGHYKVHHGGNTSGFSAQLVMYPHQKIGIIVLTNQTSSILPYLVVDLLSNHLLDLPQTKANDYPIMVNNVYKLRKVQKNENQRDLSAFVGRYHAHGYGNLEITEQNNKLNIAFPSYQFILEHKTEQVFEMHAVDDFPRFFDPRFDLTFTSDVKGNMTGISVYFQSSPVTFSKINEK